MSTAHDDFGSLGDAIGVPGGHTVAQQLGRIEGRLGTITEVLLALARAQGIDPKTVG